MNTTEAEGNNLTEIKPMPEGMKLGKVNIVLSEKWDDRRGCLVENIEINSEFENDANGHVIIRTNTFALGAVIKTLLETRTLYTLIPLIMASWKQVADTDEAAGS